MNTKHRRVLIRLFFAAALGVGLSFSLAARDGGFGGNRLSRQNDEGNAKPAASSPAIPWSQLGAKAGADYKGDGLAVVPTAGGARLRCAFQRLEGEATREGLWLSSTANNSVNDRFRIVTAAIGRQSIAGDEVTSRTSFSGTESEPLGFYKELASEGTVTIEGQTVRFIRPGLTEEYSVSMDGVRQDFVLSERPGGAGKLAVRLAVSAATIEPAPEGAQLVLENSGRKIAYNRLRVTDATGKELPARMEVQQTSACSLHPSGFPLVVLVNDADAVYPVRIDPTFSDANWISMNPSIPGASDVVYAAVVDGAGNLYIGGNFIVVGDVVANHIAKWTGSSWSALGSGMDGDRVLALAVSGSDLYAGGVFTTAGGITVNGIAKWNGSSWSALGSGMNYAGMNGYVYALAVSGTDLFAGGIFTTAGGSAADYIAKWNGSAWSALGSGINGTVETLAVSSSNLYAGGSFRTAGGIMANGIARWNGSSWSALGSGMDRIVLALAVSGSDLYAGGGFTTAGGITASGIAKWDGSSWSALGSGMDGNGVSALAVSGSNVYAGGVFTTADGSAANYIAKWDGSSWSGLGSGMNGPVEALLVSGSNVYAGGVFTTAGGSAANYIAKWNGSSWTALGSGGINGNGVSALAVSGSDLYAGGGFTTAGGSAANYIAKWNGNSWSALGSGMTNYGGENGSVYALAVSGSDLYAGGYGYFTTAGGVAAYGIAKWDGSSWSALSSGTAGYVYALAVSGSDLYAGGYFTEVGLVSANYIAKWNGSSWNALDLGMNGSVYALAVSGSDLYAGGGFRSAGGVAATNIAKWNGNSWSALGFGMNGPVEALVVSGSNVYAGGYFTTAGGTPANHIAKWNGSGWSALGSGTDDGVLALAVSGTNLYAGGYFTNAGVPSKYIAKWNGSSWSALGSGLNSTVRALAVSGSDLYAGGGFATAGGKVSPYLARAYLDLPTLSIFRSGGSMTLSWPTDFSGGFTLEQADTLSVPVSWMTNTASIIDDGTNKSATLPASNPAQFFRLRKP